MENGFNTSDRKSGKTERWKERKEKVQLGLLFIGWFYKLALLDFELIFEPKRSQKITKRIS